MDYFPKTSNETSTEDMQQRELQDCTKCESGLVQLIDHEEMSDENWKVCLWCPECENVEHQAFSQETCERYDEELDRGTDIVIKALRNITEEIFKDQVELFTYALKEDHILVEDF